MADKRGVYTLLTKVEDSEGQALHRTQSHSTIISWLRPSRTGLRITLWFVVVSATLLGYLHWQHPDAHTRHPEDPNSLARLHIQHLGTPLKPQNGAYRNDVPTDVVGEHHHVSGDFSVDFEWIDPSSGEPFNQILTTNGMNNNAMARLPAGSPYDMMVVGRGRSNEYMDETEGIPYVNLTLVGFFVNYEPRSGLWIRVGPEPYILDLPIWRQYPRPCSNLVNGGPADPRLIWSDAGEPLAVIGTSSRVPGICKSVGLVDLRSVWPGLKEHFDFIGYDDIPIRFKHFTEIGKVGDRAPYEKNWAAFFPGPKPATPATVSPAARWLQSKYQRGPSVWPYFKTQITERTIVQVDQGQLTAGRSKDSYVLAEPIDLTTTDKDNTTIQAGSQCILNSMPQWWNSEKLHLATPFHRVTFCERGTCEPTRRNTVLLGLIHFKRSPRSYRRMFVTMKVDAPFEIISVSPPLHFGRKEMDRDVVFSVSMAFMPTRKSTAIGETPFKPSEDHAGGWLSHGWLDDTIVVGAGLRDAAYDAIHLPMRMALQGHTLC